MEKRVTTWRVLWIGVAVSCLLVGGSFLWLVLPRPAEHRVTGSSPPPPAPPPPAPAPVPEPQHAGEPAAPSLVGIPVDLSTHCNAGMTNAVGMGVRIHPNNLAEFPTGELEVSGIRFLVSGMIQLGTIYPRRVPGILVGARCKRLHLLHGTGGSPPEGTTVARLILHYADGSAADLPIVYGRHVRDWWSWRKNEPAELDPDSEVAWWGSNESAGAKNCQIRVYRSAFVNPKPDAIIESFDYGREASSCNPFLLGLTVE